MVASIIAYSLSGSSAKALKRLSQTPLAAQREKRLCVFFQSPKRSGKSRHGAPEQNFQITASSTPSSPGRSNMVSSRMLSMMERKPRAPVLRSIARLAMALRASSGRLSLTSVPRH